MKHSIHKHVKSHESLTCNWSEIYLIDWKKYTNENLKIHQVPQLHPITGNPVGSVCLYNHSTLSILIDSFGENALQYTKKRRCKQCECVIYPEKGLSNEWILFIEMKYAESEFAAFHADSNYPQTMIRQITDTVQFFRDKEIIEKDKDVFALIAFPNLLSPFNSNFLSTEKITDIYLEKRIILRAGNKANILNSKNIDLLG